MKNRTLFPTDNSARVSLALAMNRINQFNTQILLTERDPEIVQSIVVDIARANDIVVNFMGFGSIRASDVAWIVEAHDRNELWTSKTWLEQCEAVVHQLVHNVLGNMVLWYDVEECTWNVNLSKDDAMPSFEGNLSDAIDFVGNTFAGNI